MIMINKKVMTVATQIMVMAIIVSIILLFVGIGLLIFIHVCIVGRAFRRGFGNVSVLERDNNGSTSMSKDDLEKLPCFAYTTSNDAESSPLECVVCLESYQDGEKCRFLPICKHSFHAQCVDAWLLQTPFCPICRTRADSGRKGEESSSISSHLSTDTSLDLRGGSQTTEISSQLSEIRIEVGEGESQRMEGSTEFSDISSEVREVQRVDNLVSGSGVETGENQNSGGVG